MICPCFTQNILTLSKKKPLCRSFWSVSNFMKLIHQNLCWLYAKPQSLSKHHLMFWGKTSKVSQTVMYPRALPSQRPPERCCGVTCCRKWFSAMLVLLPIIIWSQVWQSHSRCPTLGICCSEPWEYFQDVAGNIQVSLFPLSYWGGGNKLVLFFMHYEKFLLECRI